jgi:hypothetical protein
MLSYFILSMVMVKITSEVYNKCAKISWYAPPAGVRSRVAKKKEKEEAECKALRVLELTLHWMAALPSAPGYGSRAEVRPMGLPDQPYERRAQRDSPSTGEPPQGDALHLPPDRSGQTSAVCRSLAGV